MNDFKFKPAFVSCTQIFGAVVIPNSNHSTLNHEELDNLIARVSEARDHGLTLSFEDIQLLLDALKTLANLQERLSNRDVTVHKLRKLLEAVS